MNTEKFNYTLPAGLWNDEPDKATWLDPVTGLDCMIVRNEMGALCGYVGVPLTSKLVGLPYESLDVQVHGGLTYANRCAGKVCHPAPEEVYWFGFDCAHCWDLSPLSLTYRNNDTYTKQETYRTFDYVKGQVELLALQIKGLL